MAVPPKRLKLWRQLKRWETNVEKAPRIYVVAYIGTFFILSVMAGYLLSRTIHAYAEERVWEQARKQDHKLMDQLLEQLKLSLYERHYLN